MTNRKLKAEKRKIAEAVIFHWVHNLLCAHAKLPINRGSNNCEFCQRFIIYDGKTAACTNCPLVLYDDACVDSHTRCSSTWRLTVHESVFTVEQMLISLERVCDKWIADDTATVLPTNTKYD